MSWLLKNAAKSTTFQRLANWNAEQAGYRKKGLLADDLLISETEQVQEALRRLPKRQFYDRIFRIRRAMSIGITNETLPQEEWITPETDVPYLRNVLAIIQNEEFDKQLYDQMTAIPSDLKSINRY